MYVKGDENRNVKGETNTIGDTNNEQQVCMYTLQYITLIKKTANKFSVPSI